MTIKELKATLKQFKGVSMGISDLIFIRSIEAELDKRKSKT